MSAVDVHSHRTALRLCSWTISAALFALLTVAAAAVSALTADATGTSALVDFSNYSLSVAQVGAAATSVSGFAIIAGGSANTAYTKVVAIYNSIAGEWLPDAALSIARDSLAATSVSDLALFAGGYSDDGYVCPNNAFCATVDIFNSSSGAWTIASLSIARRGLAATSVSDLALFAGGQDFTSAPSRVVDVFNSTSGVWSTAHLSAPTLGPIATSVADVALFFIGGASVDIFNSTSGLWTTAYLSSSRSGVATTSVSGLALFAGGDGSKVVDIFNSTAGVWTVAALSVARYSLAATSISSLALFAGGQVDSGCVNVVDIFNCISGAWSTAVLSVARSSLAATSVSGLAIFAGGQLSSNFASNVVDIFVSGCLAGMFVDIAGLCQPCPPGFYCPVASALPPIPCKPGCYCPALSSVSTSCPAGTHSPNLGASNVSECGLCSAGSYNPGGQPAPDCTPCAAGTFNPYTGSNSTSSCMACGLGTYNPIPGANSSAACLPCAAGSFGNSPGLGACTLCSPGSMNPYYGSSSPAACAPCAPGSFSNVSGSSFCTLCSAGTFNPLNGSFSVAACQLCPPGQFNPSIGSPMCFPCPPSTVAPGLGSSVCGACPAGLFCPQQSIFGIPCPAGSSCPLGSGAPCLCKVFEYQPDTGESVCLPCPLAVSPRFNATSCQSQAAASSFLTFFYSTLVVMFSCIAVAAAVLTVRLVRARHTFSLRAVYVGMCVYVAMFVPYAALQAATLGELATLNSQGSSSIARAAAQISSSAAFAAFFGLGFTGKVALVQLWTHVVRRHTSGSSSIAPLKLQSTLTSTNKAFVRVVAATVVLYVIGFAVLTSYFIISSRECALQQGSACVSSTQVLQQPCVQSLRWTSLLQYYEGVWAAVVIVVFTLLAFVFNGVVFAMYVRAMRLWRDAALVACVCLTRSRLTEERALSRRQLMLVHSPFLRWLARPLLPKGWTASGFKTVGEVDAQRVALRTLGTRLAVVSILSFLCKSASVATSYFASDVIADSAQLESIIFLATALAVQAVPSTLTLLLLNRYHFNRGSDGSGALMQSLLTREGVSVAVASDAEAAAARQEQQAKEHAAEVSRLRSQVAQLQQVNQRSQEENAQLRLDVARISQQVTTLMCRAPACSH
jgi:hypothetical protein